MNILQLPPSVLTAMLISNLLFMPLISLFLWREIEKGFRNGASITEALLLCLCLISFFGCTYWVGGTIGQWFTQ